MNIITWNAQNVRALVAQTNQEVALYEQKLRQLEKIKATTSPGGWVDPITNAPIPIDDEIDRLRALVKTLADNAACLQDLARRIPED